MKKQQKILMTKIIVKGIKWRYPAYAYYQNTNSKYLKIYVRSIDKGGLVTNLFSYDIPREIKKETKGDYAIINLTGIDDIVPMINPTKYKKELPNWKKNWKIWVMNCISYGLGLKKSFAGFCWTYKPTYFIKFFHLFFPTPDNLKHKRDEVKDYLTHLYYIRYLQDKKKNIFLYIITYILNTIQSEKYEQITFIGKDTSCDILEYMANSKLNKCNYEFFLINGSHHDGKNTNNNNNVRYYKNTKDVSYVHNKTRFMNNIQEILNWYYHYTK